MAVQTHIVSRQILDVNVEEGVDAHQVQQEMAWAYHNKLKPGMEALFDQLVDADTVLRLDRLEIDIGHFAPGQFDTSFVDRVLVTIEHALRAKLHGYSSDVRVQQVESKAAPAGIFDAWIYFLDTGMLPWYAGNKEWKVWEREIVELLQRRKVSLAPLIQLLVRKRASIERLVLQFDDSVIIHLARAMDDERSVLAEALLNVVARIKRSLQVSRTISRQIDVSFWQVVIPGLVRDIEPETWYVRVFTLVLGVLLGSGVVRTEQLQSAVDDVVSHMDADEFGERSDMFLIKKALLRTAEKMLAQNGALSPDGSEPGVNDQFEKEALQDLMKTDEMLQSEHYDEEKASIDARSGLFVDNAGLVLLHPFLPRFFEKLDLLHGGAFRDESSQRRAVNLTQHLCTGALEMPESELVLNKLLCGGPTEKPVDREIELSEKERIESESLLRAVIEHWTALKNTTPDGLRNSFLLREGKLTKVTAGWRLYVDRKTQDILIDRLPWGMSMIKLPWMEVVLYVEWN